MTQELKALIEELVSESLRAFNFRKFKAIASGNEREKRENYSRAYDKNDTDVPELEYAKSNLPALGQGSSRAVFALSSGKALKIAINPAGFAQNEEEVRIYNTSRSDFVTSVFDFAPDYKWIVSEIVNPLGRDKFTQIYGFQDDFSFSPNDFFNCLTADVPLIAYRDLLRNEINDINSRVEYWEKEHALSIEQDETQDIVFSQQELSTAQERAQMQIPYYQKMLQNKPLIALLAGLTGLVKVQKLSVGEFNENHLGINLQGQVKMLDYGFNNSIWSKFYR